MKPRASGMTVGTCVESGNGRMEKNARLTGRQQRAYETIKEYWREASHRGVQSLPHLHDMAAQAGSSYATMQRVVSRLAAAGLVTARKNAGCVVKGPLPDALPSPPVQPAAVTGRAALRSRIERDILEGRYNESPQLPALKHLCARYHACHATLRHVLCALARDGLLEHRGRGFQVTAFATGAHSLTINLVAAANPDGTYYTAFPLRQTFVQALEHECLRKRIKLNLLLCPFSAGKTAITPAVEKILDRAPGGSYAGTIVQMFMLNGSEPALLAIARSRLAASAPLALISETGDDDMRRLFPCKKNRRCYSISNSPRCGEIAARFLALKGHRHAAYICERMKWTYTVNRRAGIERVMNAAGGSLRTVELFSPEMGARQTGLAMNFHSWVEHARPLLLRRFPLLADAPGESLLAMEYHQAEALGRLYSAHAIRRKLVPALEQLFQDREITAWIAAADRIGLTCLDFLRARTAGTGRQVALLSFDDTPEAMVARLTSYNFNAAGLAQTIVSGFLHETAGYHESDHGDNIIEIDGFVNERDTVVGG